MANVQDEFDSIMKAVDSMIEAASSPGSYARVAHYRAALRNELVRVMQERAALEKTIGAVPGWVFSLLRLR